jgi:predicted phosphodiesterase
MATELKTENIKSPMEFRRKAFLPFFLALVGALTFICLFSAFEYNIDGLGLKLELGFKEAGTTLSFPPVGKIKARTHGIPLEMSIELRSIDPGIFKEGETTAHFLERLKPGVWRLAKLYITRLLWLGFLGGLIGSLLAEEKFLDSIIKGGVLGLTITLFLMVGIYFSYDTNAFLTPEYQGFLETTPWLMQGIGENFSKVSQMGTNLQVLAENLSRLFQNLEEIGTLGALDGEVKILHVSDIHNNIGAFEFIEKVISTFQVSAIIDTGDITDLGTGLEINLAMKIRSLNIPYIFVPGNHDSPNSIGKLGTFSNVIILQDEFYRLGELEILGLQDPASGDPKKINPTQDELEETVIKARELLSKREGKPQIIAVHSVKVANSLAGEAPLILHGHDHKLKVSQRNGSVLVDAGTTGAAGIRGLQVPQGIPYTLALLHFSREGELLAVDTIKVDSLESGFTLERKIVDKGAEL